MNAKTMMICLLASISFTQLCNLASHENFKMGGLRAPASSEEVFSQKEIDDLKIKLSKMEDSFKKNKDLVSTKTTELKKSQSELNDLRIEKLNSLLEKQQKQIELLKEQIAKAVIKDESIGKHQEVNTIICMANSHQTKLEDELKKLIKSNEEVIQKITEIKESKKVKKEEEEKVEVSKEKKLAKDEAQTIDYSSILLAQITNMMMTSQAAQIQMQEQMFSMMNSMMTSFQANNVYSNTNMFQHRNPFDLNYNDYEYSRNAYNLYQYPSLKDQLSLYGSGVGLKLGNNLGFTANYNLQDRQPSSQFGAVSSITEAEPMIRSFDFSMNQNFTPLKQPSLLQMERVIIK
jgi:hypothetical protein